MGPVHELSAIEACRLSKMSPGTALRSRGDGTVGRFGAPRSPRHRGRDGNTFALTTTIIITIVSDTSCAGRNRKLRWHGGVTTRSGRA